MPPTLQGFAEAVTRHTARGWARDPADPARRVVVCALSHGRVIAQAPADLYRGDVERAGLGDGNCGFVLDLAPHAAALAGAEVVLADAATGAVLQGTPAIAADPPSLARHLSRWDDVPHPVLVRLQRMMRHRLGDAGVSVVATTRDGLDALRDSLRAQLAGQWELIVPAGASPVGSGNDPRVRMLARGADPIANARFDLALVVTAPLVLERDALWHLLRTAANPAAAVFLFDHLVPHPSGAIDACFRPAFDPDGFRSRPDPGPDFALRPGLVAWGRPDRVVRALFRNHAVAHIPRPLARVAPGPRAVPPPIAVRWPDPPGRTLAVIPTRNNAALLRACLESLFRTRGTTPLDIVVIDHESDEAESRAYLREIGGLVRVMPYQGPFNFARMNNLAVERFGAESATLLLLNNDTEALAPGWLARMRGLAARPEVGAVGALLLYGDRRVQHAGVVLGFDGSATHAHALKLHDPAVHPQLAGVREVSAVTAACMMLPREAFAAAGGFDEAFAVGFNDTDLCLRLRALGYRILQDNDSVLLHHESRTRKPAGQWLHPPDTALFQARHAAAIAAGDPFYNPNLRLDAHDHEPRPDCLPGGKVRFTYPGGGPTPPGAAPAAPGRRSSAALPPRRSSG